MSAYLKVWYTSIMPLSMSSAPPIPSSTAGMTPPWGQAAQMLGQLPDAMRQMQLKEMSEKLQMQQSAQAQAALIMPQIMANPSDPRMIQYLTQLYKKAGLPTTGLIMGAQAAQQGQPLQEGAQTLGGGQQQQQGQQQAPQANGAPGAMQQGGMPGHQTPTAQGQANVPFNPMQQAEARQQQGPLGQAPGTQNVQLGATSLPAIGGGVSTTGGHPGHPAEINVDALGPPKKFASQMSPQDIDMFMGMDPGPRMALARKMLYDPPETWTTDPRRMTATEITAWRNDWEKERTLVTQAKESPENYKAWIMQNINPMTQAQGPGAADAALNDPSLLGPLGAYTQLSLENLKWIAPKRAADIAVDEQKIRNGASLDQLNGIRGKYYSTLTSMQDTRTRDMTINAQAHQTEAQAAVRRADDALQSVGVLQAKNNTDLLRTLLTARASLTSDATKMESVYSEGGTLIPSDADTVMGGIKDNLDSLNDTITQLTGQPSQDVGIAHALNQAGVKVKAPSVTIPRNAQKITNDKGQTGYLVNGKAYLGSPGGQGTLAPGQ